MSIGIYGGVAASVAGTAMAQSKGPDVERAANDTGAQQRQKTNNVKAEAAAGIGETDGNDHETSERDADGRLPWQWNQSPPKENTEEKAPEKCRDPSGESGNLLDLSG